MSSEMDSLTPLTCPRRLNIPDTYHLFDHLAYRVFKMVPTHRQLWLRIRHVLACPSVRMSRDFLEEPWHLGDLRTMIS